MIPIKAIWLRPEQPFLANLGSSDPAVAAQELANIQQNLEFFSKQLFANAVGVHLPIYGGYESAYGFAFPSDPFKYPRPDLTRGFDIFVNLAAAAGLKIVAAILPSDYHLHVDFSYGMAGGNPVQAINAIINPRDSGLPGPSYIGDPRFAVWLFPAEIHPSNPTVGPAETRFMNSVCPWVHNIVHWQGAAGMIAPYALAGSDIATADAVATIHGMLNSCGAVQPDFCAFEAYQGASQVQTGCTDALEALIAALSPISASSMFLGEFGTNLGSPLHLAEVADVMRTREMLGGCAWASGGYTLQPNDMTLDQGQALYAICVESWTKKGDTPNATPPPLPWKYRTGPGWTAADYSNGTNWGTRPWGMYQFTELTPAGQALAEVYSNS